MKLFHRLPRPYQYVLISIATAVTIVFVGLFVNALLPAPDVASSSSNVGAASGISVTPIGSDRSVNTTDAPSSAASPSTTPPKDAVSASPSDSPTSSAARVPTPSDIDAYAEPYDDLAVTTDSFSVKYNHFPYEEADPARLESVGLFIRESYEREESLDYEATDAFAQMKAAAAAEGVLLMPISGFRTFARQAELFAKQTEKLGSELAAAELSAPPGHSEHHTGYAIDIGDVNIPDADIKYSFENTPAYAWLVANARSYGFEQSFPYNNQQGVSFEPWHWRYVGSPRASNIFINSRSAFPAP